MIKFIFTYFFFIISLSISAQTTNGDLTNYLKNKINNLPVSKTDEFFEPDENVLQTAQTIANYIFNNDLNLARDESSFINYKITQWIDLDDTEYWILEEKQPEQYFGGTFIFNPNACRPMISIQAPHSKYDTNTGNESIYIFKNLSAHSLFLPGTHRCNSTTSSQCDGITSTCSEVATSYTISDLSHNTENLFHTITRSFSEFEKEMIFIQLHGFSQGESDPHLILSHSSTKLPPLNTLVEFAEYLKELNEDITYKIAHIDLSWTRLRGLTNVQGRMLNGETNECNDVSSNSTGRFWHIEQSFDLIRRDSIGWQLMTDALIKTFDCLPLSNKILREDNIKITPNPSSGDITIAFDKILKKRVYIINTEGQVVFSFQADNTITTLNIKHLPIGMYNVIYTIRDQIYNQRFIKSQ